MDNKQVSPGEIVLLAAGAVGLLGSFLPWVDAGRFSPSTWSTDFGVFPVAWFVPMSAVVAALMLALPKFANVTLPPNVLGFTIDQVRKIFAFMGALLAVGWVIAIDEPGIGFWLSVAAAIAAAVGVVMVEKNEQQTPA